MKKTPQRIDINQGWIDFILQCVRPVLREEDFNRLKAVMETFAYMSQLIEKAGTTIRRLRRLIFGSKTEKTCNVLKRSEDRGEPGAGERAGTDGNNAEAEGEEEDRSEMPEKGGEKRMEKRKGHGRNGASAYTGAEKVEVPHESLKSGDACLGAGCNGKVYELKEPAVLVRFKGQAPVGTKVYRLQRLRCNLCGTVFTATAPKEAEAEKYDVKVSSIIALLHYGSGLPFNRLQGLQGAIGIPLPASTQWEIMERLAKLLKPVYEELIIQAAQGAVLYNDDTSVKILELIKENKENGNARKGEKKEAEEEGFG